MQLIHPPKRWAYVIVVGILVVPVGLVGQLGFVGLLWSIVVSVIGISGDADHVNRNADVTVRRWKWAIATLLTSFITGTYYLYRRRIWFGRNRETES